MSTRARTATGADHAAEQVDDERLAKALRRLDAVVAEYPELIGESAADNVDEWIETLRDSESEAAMARQKIEAVRR